MNVMLPPLINKNKREKQQQQQQNWHEAEKQTRNAMFVLF
jgi:hypothetical protein